MAVDEEILERNCTTDCPRYAAGTCPFLPSEKATCPRVKEYLRAIYNLAIPESSGMSAKEFLEDERLSYLAWKNIVKFRFNDISYEAFENVIKIVGKVNLENIQEEIDRASKDWDIDKILKEHFRTSYKNGK